MEATGNRNNQKTHLCLYGKVERNQTLMKKKMERGEKSLEALGAIWRRKVCSFETVKGARYTINDKRGMRWRN